MDKYGRVTVPSDAASVWMSEMELVKLFDVIAPTLRAAIRAVYKSGVLPLMRWETYQDAQRILFGNLFPPYGRGTCFPN